MIKLTSEEHIKKSGDFEIDKVGLLNFIFYGPTKQGEKFTLSANFRPFSYMDDGSRLYDMDKDIDRTIKILDVEDYLMNGGDSEFNQAYFAVENALAKLLTMKTDWVCEFEAPQA